MSITKTLGGDRLGSGKKMRVELHGYERSTHDLGYIWRSTMSAGTLVPFMCEVGLPGDTFDINLDVDIKTHPTIGPLFGSYKVQLDIFQAPIRLYNSLLHNNELGIGLDMSKVKLPQIELTALPFTGTTDPDNEQINPSSIMSYLGVRGIGSTTLAQTRQFNAVPLLAYWEIYKNYYANKQEKIGAVIHVDTEITVPTVNDLQLNIDGTNELIVQAPSLEVTRQFNNTARIYVNYTGATPPPSTIIINTEYWGAVRLSDMGEEVVTSVGQYAYQINFAQFGAVSIYNWRYQDAGTIATAEPNVVTFDLEDIDSMRRAILSFQSTSSPFIVNSMSALEPYKWIYAQPEYIPNLLSSQEGLGLKTYQSDLFNNWLDTTYMNTINTTSAVSTSGGSFTMDQLNLSKKVYDLLNRIAVSGGSYNDWLDAVWAHDRTRMAESPIYHGGLIRELVFQEVVSNAQSAEQPLGTLAGKGVMGQRKKGGTVVVKVEEPSYIMGIISLTPRIDYSQGNKWDVNLQTMDDLHKPALDEIGFQDLITEQMAWWTTEYSGGQWVQKSAGKQPAWLNYMTNVNQTRGNFAIQSNEMFMTLNRRYERNADEIVDLTTYIDPSKFNFIFAETALDSQNFWAQIGLDITARRKMSAKLMPNLQYPPKPCGVQVNRKFYKK